MTHDGGTRSYSPKDSETPEPNRAVVPYSYYSASDEIDLVGVSAKLWRRWKMMLIVFLVCLGLALLAAFLIPRNYEFITTIQVGTQIVGNAVQPIEPPDSAAKKVANGFLPEIIQDYAQRNGLNPKSLKLNSTSPQKTNLVVISGKAPEHLAGAYVDIEKSAAQKLVDSELPLTKVMRAKLESQLAEAKAKLQELQNPKYKALLQNEIKSLQGFQQQARKQQILANRNLRSANDAMSALMLGNQIQDSEKRLSKLQQTLEVNIPGEILSAKAKVSSLNTEIDNLQSSQIVAGPLKSAEPIGMSHTLTVIVGAIIGIMLALLSATIASFASAVKERLKASRSD